MAATTHGSNLGANEAVAGETALHVLDAGRDGSLYIDVQVETEGLFLGGNPKLLAVAKDAVTGATLGKTLISTDSDYPFYGLVSIETPVVGRARLRLEDATKDTRVRFEVYVNVETLTPTGAPTATGQAYPFRDLMSGVQPPPENGSTNVFEDATGLVESVTTAAIVLGGAYFAAPIVQDLLSDE